MKIELGNGITAQSYSEEGDSFLLGMMNTEKRWAIYRDKFTSFLSSQRINTWHIHDGWLTNMGYHNGSGIEDDPQLRLTWIHNHAGWSHTARAPRDGEKTVIIKDSPTGEEGEPFLVRIFEAKEDYSAWSSERYILKRTGEMWVQFREDNYYVFIPPPLSMLDKALIKLGVAQEKYKVVNQLSLSEGKKGEKG